MVIFTYTPASDLASIRVRSRKRVSHVVELRLRPNKLVLGEKAPCLPPFFSRWTAQRGCLQSKACQSQSGAWPKLSSRSTLYTQTTDELAESMDTGWTRICAVTSRAEWTLNCELCLCTAHRWWGAHQAVLGPPTCASCHQLIFPSLAGSHLDTLPFHQHQRGCILRSLTEAAARSYLDHVKNPLLPRPLQFEATCRRSIVRLRSGRRMQPG